MLSIELDAETQEKLAGLAAKSRRSEANLAAEAVREFVESEEWQLREIEAGIKDIEEGRTVEHEKVVEWLGTWGSDTNTDRPR